MSTADKIKTQIARLEQTKIETAREIARLQSIAEAHDVANRIERTQARPNITICAEHSRLTERAIYLSDDGRAELVALLRREAERI